MPRALVVADDLTGAIDTARAFAARGYRTMEPDELLVSEPVARELAGRADVEVGELRPLAFEDGALSPLD